MIQCAAAAVTAVALTGILALLASVPAPARLGGIRYLDIWLVDKSGRFQLDTLTEGQL